MSSSNSPCAACKLQRRKCTQECIYAPYFPPDQPHKFANVHKVFGASNVAKLLNEINVAHREDAVNSLAYEAEARLHDPVYGCVNSITLTSSKSITISFSPSCCFRPKHSNAAMLSCTGFWVIQNSTCDLRILKVTLIHADN
ncbi:unnamed protein product, partial [Vitis vinifera]